MNIFFPPVHTTLYTLQFHDLLNSSDMSGRCSTCDAVKITLCDVTLSHQASRLRKLSESVSVQPVSQQILAQWCYGSPNTNSTIVEELEAWCAQSRFELLAHSWWQALARLVLLCSIFPVMSYTMYRTRRDKRLVKSGTRNRAKNQCIVQWRITCNQHVTRALIPRNTNT